jgi:hypothetical protein
MSEVTKKKIYVFNNGGTAMFMELEALGEDGNGIFAQQTLRGNDIKEVMGITSTEHHEDYDKAYGEGNWELEYIEGGKDKILSHKGIQAAVILNQKQAEE